MKLLETLPFPSIFLSETVSDMLLPGSAGGIRGIGGSVEDDADPLLWHGCDSREDGRLSAPLCSWQLS